MNTDTLLDGDLVSRGICIRRAGWIGICRCSGDRDGIARLEPATLDVQYAVVIDTGTAVELDRVALGCSGADRVCSGVRSHIDRWGCRIDGTRELDRELIAIAGLHGRGARERDTRDRFRDGRCGRSCVGREQNRRDKWRHRINTPMIEIIIRRQCLWIIE